MTDRELMQQALDALIDAADSQNWEMQQNIDQHGEWYRRSVNLKRSTTNSRAAIDALRARLAQPEPEELGEVIPADEEQLKRIAKLIEPEPVAWVAYENGEKHGIDFDEDEIAELPVGTMLYTAPPQREWQGLTDEEILEEYRQSYGDDGNLTDIYFARAIEAKLKEKNT